MSENRTCLFRHKNSAVLKRLDIRQLSENRSSLNHLIRKRYYRLKSVCNPGTQKSGLRTNPVIRCPVFWKVTVTYFNGGLDKLFFVFTHLLEWLKLWEGDLRVQGTSRQQRVRLRGKRLSVFLLVEGRWFVSRVQQQLARWQPQSVCARWRGRARERQSRLQKNLSVNIDI